jgi:tRNA-modifying protein YgfZ
MAYAAILDDRSVIALSGGEARDFLQGLITNDMASCAPGRPIYTGLLTPQGKILFDFFVLEHDGVLLIDCAKERASDLLKRLAMYRLRAKIEIASRPQLAVAAVWGGAWTSPLACADPRLPALGQRITANHADVTRAIAGLAPGDYELHRLSLGVPGSADLPPDSVLALDAGFEELNGVNFKKGCYVGQEVTARMKHRATARKRFVIAQVPGQVPPRGTPILADGMELGSLATGKGGMALALVRLDRLQDALAQGAKIVAAGQTLSLRRPEWLHV